MRLEESFRRLETFTTNFDNPPIGQGVRFHQNCRLQRQSLLHLDIVPDVAQFLLHHADSLEVGGVVEGVASNV